MGFLEVNFLLPNVGTMVPDPFQVTRNMHQVGQKIGLPFVRVLRETIVDR